MYLLIWPSSDAAAALGWKNSHLVAQSSSTSRRCSTSYLATSGFPPSPGFRCARRGNERDRGSSRSGAGRGADVDAAAIDPAAVRLVGSPAARRSRGPGCRNWSTGERSRCEQARARPSPITSMPSSRRVMFTAPPSRRVEIVSPFGKIAQGAQHIPLVERRLVGGQRSRGHSLFKLVAHAAQVGGGAGGIGAAFQHRVNHDAAETDPMPAQMQPAAFERHGEVRGCRAPSTLDGEAR